jgi:transcriptional regulator with XRE-family HTH domain
LTTIDSPAAARRRLRFALRDAREAAGFTQTTVAERLGWSFSKVNRIENGEVTISAGDLRELMTLLGVTDQKTVEQLTSYARAARRRGWWDDPDHRPHLTQAMRQLFQYEAEATSIRCFHPVLVPGILQTADYARTILDFWTELPEETRNARQAIRVTRRERLFGRTDRPPYYLVLDESVIMRQVGGPTVMAEQLSVLVDMIRAGHLVVRIVPLVRGAIVGQVGSFVILDLDDESAILYREVSLDDDSIRENETVARYRRTFEQLWATALTPEESANLIEGHAAIMNASISRQKPNV